MFSKQRSLRSIMVLRNSRKQLSTNNWKMEKFKHFPLIKKMLKIIHNLIIILILMVLDIISKINKFLRILFLFLESKLVSINLFFIWFPLKNKVFIIFFCLPITTTSLLKSLYEWLIPNEEKFSNESLWVLIINFWKKERKKIH